MRGPASQPIPSFVLSVIFCGCHPDVILDHMVHALPGLMFSRGFRFYGSSSGRSGDKARTV